MEAAGVPGADLTGREASESRFPDGAHYRIELAGVERLSTLEALVKESERRNAAVHRVIATVAGSVYLDRKELGDFARLAAESRLAVIMTPARSGEWTRAAR